MITRARVEGMMCQHCIRAVYTALAAVEGVDRAEVGLGWIEVEHDGRVRIEEMRRAVEVVGYRVAEEKRRGLPILAAESR